MYGIIESKMEGKPWNKYVLSFYHSIFVHVKWNKWVKAFQHPLFCRSTKFPYSETQMAAWRYNAAQGLFFWVVVYLKTKRALEPIPRLNHLKGCLVRDWNRNWNAYISPEVLVCDQNWNMNCNGNGWSLLLLFDSFKDRNHNQLNFHYYRKQKIFKI